MGRRARIDPAPRLPKAAAWVLRGLLPTGFCLAEGVVGEVAELLVVGEGEELLFGEAEAFAGAEDVVVEAARVVDVVQEVSGRGVLEKFRPASLRSSSRRRLALAMRLQRWRSRPSVQPDCSSSLWRASE